MVRKPVPVGELRLGMYVAELDCPWTDTPFRFQGFVLERAEQLAALQKHCKIVYIDPERGETLGGAPEQTSAPMRSAADLSRTRVARHPELAPIEQEYPAAIGHHAASSLAFVESVLRPLQAGATLDAQRVTEAVTGLAESVLRNPDALLLFTQLKEKGDYTQSHAMDSSVYLTVFGRFLEMSREDVALLGHLGLLQDIGKLRLPTELLEKRERLTGAELAIARRHVDYSVEILAKTPHLPAGLAELAGLHHERVDGSGYPKKLRGGQIGLLGSMAAIVDTFAALTTRRAYAEPLAPSTALSILYKHRGTLLDGYLVEQFIRCIGIFPLGSVVEMNTGEVGIVIAQNLAKRLQPRILVVRDPEGQDVKPHRLVDLSREPKTARGEVYRIRKTLEYGRVPVAPEALFA